MKIKQLINYIQTEIQKGNLSIDDEIVYAHDDDYWGTCFERLESQKVNIGKNLSVNGPKKW
jgi:hypothetical protein